MAKQKIKVDVVTDVVCPWCYLGEHRLHTAIDALKDEFDVEVKLKPFELDPNTPQEGKNHVKYLLRIMGSEERVKESHNHLTQTAAAEGLHYDFSKVEVIPNTFRAHRLIWLAGKYGVEDTVADDLYKAYFAEGKDVNNVNILKAIALSNGIPAERLDGFFEGEEGAKEVRQMQSEAHQSGITAVPAFIINNKYLISGAQSAETFKSAFKQIAGEMELVAEKGEICDDEGCEV